MSNYKKGDIIEGKVTGIENYGIFLSFDDNYTGLIHISEISSSFVRSVNDYAEMNEIIKAKVLDIDESRKKMKLSLLDIDYRPSRGKTRGITETKSGFSNLKAALDNWISEKEKEI